MQSVDGKVVSGDVVAESGEARLTLRRLLKLKSGSKLSVVMK